MDILISYKKSNRKNAKVLKNVHICKLDNESDFITAILIFTDNLSILKTTKKIDVSCVLEKEVFITNTYHDIYKKTRHVLLKESKNINYVEDGVKFFYDVLLKLVNFTVPDLEELYNNNPSFRYFINKYHKK